MLKDGIRGYIWFEKKEFTTEAAEVPGEHGESMAKIDD
jgi:hypothetical protein